MWTGDRYLRVGSALVGGVVAVAGSFAVAGRTPAFVVAPVASFVVAHTPAFVVTTAILTLGELGERLAFAVALGLAVALFALATGAGAALGRRTGVTFAPAVGAGVLVWVVAAALTAAPLPALAAALPPLVAVALFAVGLPPASPTPVSSARRRVVGAVGAAFGFGLLSYLVGRRGGERDATSVDPLPPSETVARLEAQARAKQFDVAGIPGLVSDTDDFYVVDVDNFDPDLDAGAWSLSVSGAVDAPFSLTYDQLRALPAETKYDTLRCVGERLNAELMDNAVWTGVPVAALLDRAGPREGCGCVMARAVDGYYEEFPLAALDSGFLAYGMNGDLLPRSHGFPVRLLVPGHWGEVNVKWVSELEVLEREATGYWEERGWHGTGPVNTVAKVWAVDHLDADAGVRVAGHAYAGTRGISRVEVSTDGVETWDEATLSDPLDEADVLGERDAWRQWQYTWSPSPGDHEVVVRATDGEGTLQPRKEQSPFPNGASGWVSVTVSV